MEWTTGKSLWKNKYGIFWNQRNGFEWELGAGPCNIPVPYLFIGYRTGTVHQMWICIRNNPHTKILDTGILLYDSENSAWFSLHQHDNNKCYEVLAKSIRNVFISQLPMHLRGTTWRQESITGPFSFTFILLILGVKQIFSCPQCPKVELSLPLQPKLQSRMCKILITGFTNFETGSYKQIEN
jgi:hypothetical protein